MSPCGPCQDEINQWLDHRKPLHRSVVLQIIGTGANSVLPAKRTHETLKAQIDLIRSNCTDTHWSKTT